MASFFQFLLPWIQGLWNWITGLFAGNFNGGALLSNVLIFYAWIVNAMVSMLPGSITQYTTQAIGWFQPGGWFRKALAVCGYFVDPFISFNLLCTAAAWALILWPLFVLLRLAIWIKGHIWSQSR